MPPLRSLAEKPAIFSGFSATAPDNGAISRR
jgi:hypothetical protein